MRNQSHRLGAPVARFLDPQWRRCIEIGPKEFVERSGFKFSSGQIMSVVGMPIVISHREMVLAREITTGDSVFVVRDRNGEWT